MGLFAASLDCPEQYRPWCGAGLDLLFLPDGLPQAETAPATTVPEHPQHTATASAPVETSPSEASSLAPVAEKPSWPAPWSVLAGRVTTPPKVIITYASLAQDLAGAADPERRKLFQRILSYLAWPPGTTLFWPLSFAPGVDPQGRFAADIFSEGIRHFGIGHVLCFGEDVSQRCGTLFPAELKEGPRIYPLPDPSALVSLLPHELQLSLVHLKDISL